MTRRREFLHRTAAFGFTAALARAQSQPGSSHALVPPADGKKIPVAFALSEGAVMIDFAGPWEVFQDVRFPDKLAAFELFTVAETTQPIRASAGMRITPDYSFDTAPLPKVIIIPAQRGNAAMLEWIRGKSRTADITASVCTGAFVLAKTGLLAGKSATTHHGAYQQFATQFPDVRIVRGARFVDEGNLASSGGLSSGIDLALHIVERYFGRDVAARTADQMEYQGLGWTDPGANRKYDVAPKSSR